MKTIIIKQNDINKRIDNFLSKMLPNLPMSTIYKLIRNKKIKVNGKKTNFNYRLLLDDQISLYINTEEQKSNNLFLKASAAIKVVYEDENVLIIEKDIAQVVYDEQDKTIDTLLNRVKHYLYLKNEYNPENENYFSPAPAHRLDTNTKGLIVFAKNIDALRELNYIFKEKLIFKTYKALVYGLIKHSGKINCFIKKNKDKNIVHCSFDKKDPFYKEAITEYKVIKFIKNKYTLLDINLITGRTHQIRASFNLLGFPLVGEQKYISKFIDKNPYYKHQCLCSYKIKFKSLHELNKLKYLSNKEFKINNLDFEE